MLRALQQPAQSGFRQAIFLVGQRQLAELGGPVAAERFGHAAGRQNVRDLLRRQPGLAALVEEHADRRAMEAVPVVPAGVLDALDFPARLVEACKEHFGHVEHIYQRDDRAGHREETECAERREPEIDDDHAADYGSDPHQALALSLARVEIDHAAPASRSHARSVRFARAVDATFSSSRSRSQRADASSDGPLCQSASASARNASPVCSALASAMWVAGAVASSAARARIECKCAAARSIQGFGHERRSASRSRYAITAACTCRSSTVRNGFTYAS